MTDDTSKKIRNYYPDRITLTADAQGRVDTWLGQVRPHLKGNSCSRSDLVNWLITNHDVHLSEDESKRLTAAFFDPMKALAWASREIQERQKAGENIDVAAFMTAVLGTPSKPKGSRPVRPGKLVCTSEPKTHSEG